jgi:hypothetical protein
MLYFIHCRVLLYLKGYVNTRTEGNRYWPADGPRLIRATIGVMTKVEYGCQCDKNHQTQ